MKIVKGQYDLIICNPPFFSNSMLPATHGRGLARHSASLSLEQIFRGSGNILSTNGRLSIIFPFEMMDDVLIRAGTFGLFPLRLLSIIPVPGKEAKRVCMDLSFTKGELHSEEMIIEDGGRHHYSSKYRKLTKDYYLDF